MDAEGTASPAPEFCRNVALRTSRLPFLLAVALVAAAIADPLVETISNSGILGGGYDDNNHLSALPVFIAGALLVVVVIAVRCLSVIRSGSSLRRDDWLAESATQFSQGSPLHDLPAVLVLQLAAVFTMESIEQLVFGGKLLGGAAWLGGPIAFSLLSHALIGTSCTLLFAAVMRWIHAAIVSLVHAAVDAVLLSLVRDSARAFAKQRNDALPLRAQAPHVRQIGGRAPPALRLVA